MSLLAQLQAASAEAAKGTDTCRITPNSPYHTEARRAQFAEVLAKAHAAHTSGAIQKYKAVMSNGWRTQRQIEMALGYGATCSTVFLNKLLTLNLVERRNRGGAKTYARRSGYEWRWRVEQGS